MIRLGGMEDELKNRAIIPPGTWYLVSPGCYRTTSFDYHAYPHNSGIAITPVWDPTETFFGTLSGPRRDSFGIGTLSREPFGTLLGPCRDHFETLTLSFWDSFAIGSLLGPCLSGSFRDWKYFWDLVGTLLGPFRDHFEALALFWDTLSGPYRDPVCRHPPGIGILLEPCRDPVVGPFRREHL